MRSERRSYDSRQPTDWRTNPHDHTIARPGWYPDPSGAPRQRYFDGQWTEHYAPLGRPLTGTPAPKRSTPWNVLLPVGGVLLLLVMIGSAIGGEDEKQPTAGSSSASSRTQSAPTFTAAAPAPAPLAGIGQEARDGKFAFFITAIDSVW